MITEWSMTRWGNRTKEREDGIAFSALESCRIHRNQYVERNWTTATIRQGWNNPSQYDYVEDSTSFPTPFETTLPASFHRTFLTEASTAVIPHYPQHTSLSQTVIENSINTRKRVKLLKYKYVSALFSSHFHDRVSPVCRWLFGDWTKNCRVLAEIPHQTAVLDLSATTSLNGKPPSWDPRTVRTRVVFSF